MAIRRQKCNRNSQTCAEALFLSLSLAQTILTGTVYQILVIEWILKNTKRNCRNTWKCTTRSSSSPSFSLRILVFTILSTSSKLHNTLSIFTPNNISIEILVISFLISFAEIMDEYPDLAHFIFSQPDDYLRLFDEAAFLAQVLVSLCSIIMIYTEYNMLEK